MPSLTYRVPDLQDPVVIVGALTQAGYDASESSHAGDRYVTVALPDEPEVNHREHVRRVIADADETSLEGPRFDPGKIGFEDER